MSWPRCSLDELVRNGSADLQTGPFGTHLRAAEYVENGVPVINVRNIGYGQLKSEKLEHVSAGTADRLALHRLRANDIVLGRKGSVDRHVFIEEEQDGWVQGSDCIRLRFHTNQICARFVSYAFLRPEHQEWLLRQASNQATMASLNQDLIRRISIPLPPFADQLKVVDVLAAYDQLIENSRRRIAKLETAVSLFYKQGFLRPQDFRTAALGDVSTYIGRGIAPRYDDAGNSIVINQKCIRNNQLDLSFSRRQNRSIPQHKRLQPGDVLINSTGAGTLGRVAQVKTSKSLATTLCTVDSHITIVRPSAALGIHYAGCVLAHHEPFFAQAGRGATNQTELSRDEVGKLPITVPPQSVVAAFDAWVDPYFEQVRTLLAQTEKLRAARDLLLPRLLDDACRAEC